YYFDLSAMGIPGTVNDALPDKTMRYVPFTYVGTVDAYLLKNEDDSNTQPYEHSLFVADYAVTHTANWNTLNDASLIFGKNYTAGGVDYTLRAPSVGSKSTGSGESQRGTPESNEWDRLLDKNDGYIKNWSGIYSWGQDTSNIESGRRAVRGYNSTRNWYDNNATSSDPILGFRPVLEVLNSGTLGADGLKAVTLDLGGGKLGGSSENIRIIVKSGESFAAPASDGLTRPDGNADSYFQWLGNNGKLYAPGESVPADVITLTAQFDFKEQFTLAPGGTYYFDLSGENIPGTVSGNLPDKSMHYVPFTYAGTVDAYKLTSEMATTEEYAEQKKYPHSLFVADYAVAYAASWDHLNDIDMIFGKDYTAGGVDYTMRAPSEGSDYTGSGDSERGTPQSNEWDRLLDKDDGYIKNWNGIFSCGQDTVIRLPWRRTVRGHYSSRFCGHRHAAGQNPQVGFRPVLEVLNHDTIGPDGLKAVALDLGGGKLGDESSIRIIVKNGSAFTAPSGDGLTRPEGATGNYFKWLGSDGKLYAPGESVSADVTTLTARFVPDTYTVIVTTDTLPDGKTGKAYSHTLTAISTAPITWRIDEGALPAGLRLNEKTGEISGIPTAAGTATFTVKAENSEGSDTRALSIIISNPVEQTPVRYLDADGKERFCTEYTVLESVIIEDFFDSDNKWYDMPAGWYVVEGDVTITPRLDTHGAVNLILKDDCHLTVPWGINVKEGDTFTIYAQSTAEASMGKLTACLPELSDHEKSVWPVAGLSGIGAGVRVWAANDNYYENEGTIIINGGNIHAKGQQGSSAIGGSDYDRNVSSDGDTPGNLRQGGSITINGGIVCTELRTSGGAHTADSFGIGTCGGNGGSVTINGGTIIAEASSSAISSGRGGSITINGGNVTAHGGINRYENQPQYAIPGNGIGPLEGGSITINGGTVKASTEGDGFGIGGAGVHHTAEMHITINGGNIETTANRNNAAIGDKSKQKSSVTITDGVIHAVGKGSAAGIGSTGDIRITGGEISAFAEGGGAAIGSIGGVDCKSITINGNVIKSISSKDGACIGGTTGGSVGSITISDAELPLLSSNKILIGWDADSPGGKLTIRNCRVESTDIPTTHTDGIRVGSNSELVIEESEIRLPHFRSIRVGGNGSIAVRDSDLHTYGIFMDETAQSPNDAKTLKKLEITDSTVLTGDIIGARGGYSSVEEVVIHDSSIRLNDEYTYNYCTIGGGTNGSFGSIDIQNSQIHIPSSGGNTAIGNGWQVYYNRESRIRIANSEVSVRCASLGPAIGAAWDSGSGRINIIIENSTVTAKGGNLRTDGNYVPGIGKNALGRAPEIGIQILNSTVDSFRLTEREGTDYVYDDLHTKELPGIPAENISICGSTVNGKTIDHIFDQYGKCTLCGKYDLGYCYEHGLLTMEGLTDCVSDGSEKKLTGLSHQTGENETKQLAENTDYTASYSNNVNPYTLNPNDAGFDPEKAPKVTLYGTGNYCGKAEHYFTISENAAAAPSITTSSLPDGKVGEAYSQTLTATGTTPIKWSISGGALPDGLTLKETTGEISGTPTADGTAKFTVKAENSAGSDTKELSIAITKATPTEFTVTVTSGGNGTASASPAKAVAGAEITLTAMPNEGYRFKEWEVISGGVAIENNKFLMPDSNVEVKAIFEEDAPPEPTNPAKPSISVTGTYTYNGSEHTATVRGYDPATMDISGNTGTDAGDYTVSVTSKTGKWADGSTDAVTTAWSIGKATQEAPAGLNGVAPSAEGGSDGKITGVDSTMEYRMAGESSYTACSGTEIENLSAGNYFVRYAEDNNHFAGTDAEVTVGKGAPLADCTITFDGNGGSGSMGPVTVKAGANYILPECGFTAPADQEFKAWEISGTEYKVGDSYTVLGDTEIKALWENSVITPTTYTVTVSNDGNGTGTATPSTAVAGTTIILTATPNTGYHFKEWQVISGGVTIKDDKFLMPNDNVEVKAIFEKDAPPAPTEFTITVKTDGNGTASASHAKAVVGTEIALTATPNKGYHFKEWQVESPAGLVITNNKFTMP
ncbi:putative Ig domain-containing protein, partial [Hominifimenecus microfluidus]